MGAIRRFSAVENENSIFKFTIDTTIINVGGTDGSENPLTFRIPSRLLATNSAIIKVSDGRPDIPVNHLTSEKGINSPYNLTFSTAGVYEITIVGRLWFSFSEATTANAIGYDRKKIILVSHFPSVQMFTNGCFYNCINLVIDAPNTVLPPTNLSYFFRNIKELRNDLKSIDVSKITAFEYPIVTSMPLASTFNPFFNSLINPRDLYSNNTFTPAVTRIELKSDSINRLYSMWNNVVFQHTGRVELICETPNITLVFQLLHNGDVKTKCHAGKVDVRNVVTTTEWITSVLQTWQVDATILGWAELPFMQSGVVWDWRNSKYSNDPEVIAALKKITNDWGVIFTNLTMA